MTVHERINLMGSHKMNPAFRRYRFYLIVMVLWSATIGVGLAQEVMAILNSDVGPYREALEGFREGLGQTFSSVKLTGESPKITPEVRVIVAFGGKAAQLHYPDRVVLIYCLAPGTRLGIKDRRGLSIEVKMLPQATKILSKLKEIQPDLKRLAVLWSSKSEEEEQQEMLKASPLLGIEIISERLNNAEELPQHLRALYGKADGFFMLPDPILINARNLLLLKDFSWSNHIPFYVPTAGLVDQGAVASVSSSFREIGRVTGLAARNAVNGLPLQEIVYPEKVDITLNTKAAGNVGLQIPREIVQKADKVLP